MDRQRYLIVLVDYNYTIELYYGISKMFTAESSTNFHFYSPDLMLQARIRTS